MSLVVVLALQQRQRLSEQCIRRIIKSSQPGQTISLVAGDNDGGGIFQWAYVK